MSECTAIVPYAPCGTGPLGGAPTVWTPAIERTILDGLAQGQFLVDILKAPGMPHQVTVNEWARHDERFSLAYARARQLGAETLVRDGMKILDECSDAESSHVSKAAARAGYRQWVAARHDRETYGDRTALDVKATVVQLVAFADMTPRANLAGVDDEPQVAHVVAPDPVE